MQGGGGGEISALQGATAWLWSTPLGDHRAEDDNEETADALIEEAELEEEAQAKHLYFQRTISRAVPQEVSPSGRLYQRAQHSALEYSRPTMNIRSSWSSWSSSPRPLPPPRVPSLMSWTPTASLAPSNPRLISLESPRMDCDDGQLSRLTGWNGTTQLKTNSRSSTKEMGLPQLRVASGSPSSAKSKTRNR
uniref:Movement protein n=1 Tax=Cucurbit aphid-borne yellows virus TaxID=91753 RepID=W8E1H8_9VIRU|nr:movement protein [Cucurbit aphid-borne yellows virus]AHJ59954.1 movement protein [Cucurbit aphid-borne yellows virus]